MKYLSEEQNKCFVGTGELNKAGDSLAVFLDKYDPDKYQNPCNTVDTLVFTKEDSQVKRILLIKRENHPCIGLWACPGGFVEFKENLYDAALRELQEETGLHDIEAEQLKSYGDYDRDPRTRIITTAFVALIDEGSQKAQAGDDAREAGWFDISDELINKTEDKLLVKEEWLCRLSNADKNINICARVEVTYRKGILKNRTYMVVDGDGLAADHAAIILEGYHHVKEALNA